MKLRITFFTFTLLSFAATAHSASQQMIADYNETIKPGKRIVHQFIVDPAKSLTISASSKSNHTPDSAIQYTIRDPNRKKFDLANPQGYPRLISKDTPKLKTKGSSETMSVHTVTIEKPTPGKWLAVIEVPKDATFDQSYSLTIYPEEPTYLLNTHNEDIRYKHNLKFPVSASITKKGKPVHNAKVQATSERWIAANTPSIKLLDNGKNGDSQKNDGIYTAMAHSYGSGYISADIYATDKKKFQRQGHLQYRISKNGAKILRVLSENTIDKDKNGTFERLEFIIEIYVTDVTSTYSLYAILEDTDKHMIGLPKASSSMQVFEPSIMNAIPRKSGIHRITVKFGANMFRTSKSNGPYSLTLRMNDNTLGEYSGIIQTYEKQHQTKPYRFTDFEALK